MSRRHTILIVEDDLPLRQLYRSALMLAGFAVAEAGDGIDALRYIDQQRPDLIVLDLGLPRLDGEIIQQELAGRVELRDVPVVIVSGQIRRLDRVVAECVLQKPVDPDELVATVHRCLQIDSTRR